MTYEIGTWLVTPYLVSNAPWNGWVRLKCGLKKFREKLNKPHEEKAMGSSGSGRFSDYPGTKPSDVAGDGTGTTGGASGVDKCKKAFNVLLDDVGNSDFFSNFNNVPSVGDQLGIIFDGKRVFAIDEHGVKVGALPTSFNYLVACLEDGVAYVGVVSTSAVSPVPSVAADFAAE